MHKYIALNPDVISFMEQKAIVLTNQFRQSYGLPALIFNEQLSRVARLKAEDMRDNNYSLHISPAYGSPDDMIRSSGIFFQTFAENIAGGQATPEEVVNSWICNPDHMNNILNSQFREIGMGYSQGGSYSYYWSQLFIG